ncbi:MAG: hypothetical protein KF819_22975 [Labilithrix sp.]|nr:hypothetical protein [Labilithrix sp.]
MLARAVPLLTLSLAACSGADHADLFEASMRQDDTSATEPPAASAPGATTPSPAPSVDPGPAPSAPDAPSEPDAPACTQEIEPNDDQGRATPFTTRLCGKIDKGDSADWGRFTLPPGTTKVSWRHKETGGKATYRFYVNGMPFVGDMPGDELRVIPNATYTVQIRGERGDRPSYELEIKPSNK